MKGNDCNIACDITECVRGNNNEILGTVNGDVCGDNNRIVGYVEGNIIGNNNSVVGGSVKGCVIGCGNKIGGSVERDIRGDHNYVNYKVQGSIVGNHNEVELIVVGSIQGQHNICADVAGNVTGDRNSVSRCVNGDVYGLHNLAGGYKGKVVNNISQHNTINTTNTIPFSLLFPNTYIVNHNWYKYPINTHKKTAYKTYHKVMSDHPDWQGMKFLLENVYSNTLYYNHNEQFTVITTYEPRDNGHYTRLVTIDGILAHVPNTVKRIIGNKHIVSL